MGFEARSEPRRARLGAAFASLVLSAAPALADSPLTGPYKHAPVGLDATSQRLQGEPPPVPGGVLVWAFATGACGSEHWGDGIDTERFARANVAAFVAAGQDYIVSTGGEAGVFTCASADGMRRFLARYDSPRLRGLDFDIESKQTPAQIDALVAAARAVARPGLRLSFTVATHASPGRSRRSLNDTGEAVLASVVRHRLDDAVINLMVMNYGPADARWCVLRQHSEKACDMGLSALQAARNVHEKYGVPYARIALTVMLGENDVAGNVLSPEDAAAVRKGAEQLKLAGVHWWSLDRDQPCPAGSPRLSPLCHGLADVAPGHFGKLLAGEGR